MPNIIIPGVPYFVGGTPESMSREADIFVHDMNIVQYSIPRDLYKAAVAAYADLKLHDKKSVEFDTDESIHEDMETSHVDITKDGMLDISGEVDDHNVTISFEKGMAFIQHALASANVDYNSLEMILVYKDTHDLVEMQEMIADDNAELIEHIELENVYWKTDTDLIIPKPPVEVKYYLSMDGNTGYISKEGVAMDEQDKENEISFG